MTADDKLAAFFATQEPPAYDAQFILRSLAAFQRRELMHQLSLVALVGVLTLLVAVLVGGRLALPLNAIIPALMPVAVVMAALYLTGRLPRVRA
jgi:hypothetical protein